MKWEDMPKGHRPIFLQMTDYPGAHPYGLLLSARVEDVADDPNDYADEYDLSGGFANTIKHYHGGQVRLSQKPDTIDRYVRVGPAASPSTLGHELGHAYEQGRGPSSPPSVEKELEADSFHLRNRIRAGNLTRQEVEEMASYLASYIQNRKNVGFRTAYKRALTMLKKEIKRLQKEEGEL